jgi:hypothetical protein
MRRSGVSFCPEALNGSITASIWIVEFSFCKITALTKGKKKTNKKGGRSQAYLKFIVHVMRT